MFLKENKNKKVLVALSGGVDSSVAALLLKKQGYDVSGGYIRGYNIDGCQDRDAEDARLVAEKIGIPFYIFDLEKEYKNRVVDYLLDGYRNGITPNPDVVCNSEIKFGLFFDKAMELGFDYVASGHYVKKGLGEGGKGKVFVAKDKNKDQSYFLWQVSKERFNKLLFPLGGLKKEKVRKIALRAGLHTATKKDSQGICFLGKFNFEEFLKEHIGSKKGKIIDSSGKEVGEHDGVWFYTRGQRHGFNNTAGKPYFVVSKDMGTNTLYVAYENEEYLMSEREINAKKINFLDDKFKKKFNLGENIGIYIRTRYRQKLFRASVIKSDNGAKILFRKVQKNFSTSGQSVVFYNWFGQMLGGGVIE